MFGRSTTPLPAVPGLQTQVSRRAMLGGLASLAVLFGTPSLAFADTPTPKATPFGTPKPTATRLRDANGNPVQPGPYTVQASCDLTEDYFLTADVLVGADDQVVPFVNHLNGGAVEAVVVSQEAKTISHVYRDPSSLSGWTIKTITFPAAMGSVAQAAVAASPKGVYLGTVAPPDSAGQTLSWFTWLTDATTWATGATLGPGAPLMEFRAGVSADQTPYFYGWAGAPDANIKDNTALAYFAYICAGQQAPQMRQIMQLSYPAANRPHLDAMIQYDVNQGDADVLGVAAVLVTQNGVNSIEVYPQTPVPPNQNKLAFDTSSSLLTYAGTPNALLWANMAAPGQWQAAFSNTAGNIIYADQSSAQAGGTPLYAFGSPVNSGDLAAWVNDGAYTFTVLAGGVVGVMSQDGADAPFSLPVPLVDGVDRIYSAVTDPTQSTLFTVMADTTLSVLTKDPTTGWTQHQVHQDTADMQQVDSYRAMISILDANGVGVAGAQARVTTDRVVGLWLEPSTNTILEPGTHAIMTADEQGKIVVSIPAEELDCATLQVTPLASDGIPNGLPLTVVPHTDVTDFFAGSGNLLGVNNNKPLDGPAMQNAQSGSNAVFPNIANDSSGATAAAAAVNHMATLGLNPTVTAANGTQSAVFDMGQGKPSFQSSSDPNAFSIDTVALDAKRRRDAARLAKHRHHGKHHQHPHPIGGVGGASDWWNSVKHDADSAFHGLRHGAIKFKKMVTSWAGDVKQWTVNLIVDIGNGLDSLMSYIVSDVESAFHAISSFFQALGADIKAGVEWLKNHVIDYIKNADANATIIASWFAPFLTQLSDTITGIKADADKVFTSVEAEADTAIASIAAAVEDDLFGSSAPLPPPSVDTGSHDADKVFKAGTDVVKFMEHSPANWLLHKLRTHLPKAPSDGGPTFSSVDADMETVLHDLIVVFADVMDVVTDLGQTLWDAVKPFCGDHDTFSKSSIGEFFGSLRSTVTAALQLANHCLDALLDAMQVAVAALTDLLAYRFQPVPLIGGLLKLAGVDTTLSIERLISLIVAYPTTLANEIMGGGPLFPADHTPPTGITKNGRRAKRPIVGGSKAIDGWKFGLDLTSGIVQGVWATNDVRLDADALLTGKEKDDSFSTKNNTLMTSIDIICPVLINLLQWPAPPTSDGFTQPFWAGLNNAGKGLDLLPWMVFTSFVPPFVGLAPAVAVASGWATKEEMEEYSDYFAPVMCSLAGISNTVVSCFYIHDQGGSVVDIIETVVANASYDVSVLGFPALVEATVGGTATAKLVVDTGGNFGTAGVLAWNGINQGGTTSKNGRRSGNVRTGR